MSKPKAYAGIGSRKTPPEIQEQMTQAASELSQHGLILRSGGAKGADTAFESGVQDPTLKEIFLPWKGFNGNESPLYAPLEEAEQIAANYHPNWPNLERYVRRFMARNVHQILGASLNDPALFVLCWTPDGSASGGTGQAIRIAAAHAIPVFDMGARSLEEIAERINQLIE